MSADDSSPPPKKKRRIGCWILAAVCIAVFLAMNFVLAPFQFVFELSTGWFFFLMDVLPKVTFAPGGVVLALVCLVALAIGGHRFLGWLNAARDSGESPASQWQVRWSAAGLSILLLLFIASIASIGIVHQTIWLFTKEPVLRVEGFTRGQQRRSMSDLRTVGLAIGSYLTDHGRLPDISDGPVSRLETSLVPVHLKRIPATDGWTNPFHWQHHGEGNSYTIISFGSDGVADSALELGATISKKSDIYYSSGRFVAWPEGMQRD